jgi:hypothetical protein
MNSLPLPTLTYCLAFFACVLAVCACRRGRKTKREEQRKIDKELDDIWSFLDTEKVKEGK